MSTTERAEAWNAVYVPIDENLSSKGAVPLARTIARISGASLHLVHSSQHPPETPGELKSRLQLGREDIEGAVLEQVRAAHSGEGLSQKVKERPACAIVVPMEHGISEDVRRVMESAICPVLLVPPGSNWAEWKPARMLLPQDSTAEMAEAVRPAVTMAEMNGASLIVLHVPSYVRGRLDSSEAALPFPCYMDQPQHELPAWKQEFIERFRELGKIPEGLLVDLYLGFGEPAEEILTWSTKLHADLLVMPWSGRFEKAETLKKVLQATQCPVLAIPVRKRR